MKTNIQAEIFVMIVFGAVTSASQSFSDSHQLAVNLSSKGEDNRLLRPIVIPNLTGFSEDFFTTKSQFGSKDDEKLPEVFREKASEVTDRNKESSQESVVRDPLTKETSKPKENVSKFSSRYSSKPEVYAAILQDTKEGVHTRDLKEEKETKDEKVTKGSEIASLIEIAENESDIIPDNTAYPGNKENPPVLGGKEDKQEQTSDTDDYTDAKETGGEPETVPTSSEPHLELRISPSMNPWANRYSDEEELEDREAVKHDDTATKEHKEEEKRRADDHGDAKNYHSIQTPLHKIKFMGPHEFKDDSESNRMRTRPINPIERDHARYEWPYFKSQVKAEAEKDNEISTDGNESHNKEDSEEWQNDKNRVALMVSDSDLDKAVEKDEARFGPLSNLNKKYNVVREKNRHLENQKALIAEEEKDHGRPLFKILSHNSENQSELNFGDKTVDKTKKQERERWTSRLTSTESPVILFKNDAKSNNLESTDFKISKISKELEPEFQGLKFLNSAIFNKNNQQKQAKNSESSKKIPKNIFIQELENKEMIDQKNLNERKSKELVGGTENTSQSFNHLEESDEMYNQILANIQSVFGLRTQPLKSSLGSKGNRDPELKQEENKFLTWSTTLLRRTTADHESPESSPVKATETEVKKGSE